MSSPEHKNVPAVDAVEQSAQEASGDLSKPLDSIPKEVWMLIFSHLDYFGLKRCTMVCQAFKDLTELSDFDHALFREKAVDGAVPFPDDTIALHPFFAHLSFTLTSNDIWSGPLRADASSRDESMSSIDLLARHPVAQEKATSPALEMLHIGITNEHGWYETSPRTDGWTVLDVMEQFGRTVSIFVDSYSDHHRNQCYPYTARLMRENRVWRGFTSPWIRVTPDGRTQVILMAKPQEST